MSSRHWAGLSLLDALRPDQDRQVDCAVVATYSVDLVALVASLLALSGLDDDRGSGSKVDLAQAVEQLRDKVRFLAQAGRVQMPKKTLKVLVLLDQFLKEVHADEQTGSWHPKAALIRFVPFSDNLDGTTSLQPLWRFWVSSRNLTRDMSWDAGLLLVGQPDGSGQKIPGLTDAAMELLGQAALPQVDLTELADELASLNWQSPEKTTINSLRLLMPDTEDRGLPKCPEKLQELVVISPFLDNKTVSTLGDWGDVSTRRFLLSTSADLNKVAHRSVSALSGFGESIFALEEAADDAVEVTSEGEDSLSEEELEGQGLHAKLIYARHAAGQTLWLGSANATRRGWDGPNYEMVAELTIRDPIIAEGLHHLLEQGHRFRLDQLPDAKPDETPEDILGVARNQVACRWQAVQTGERTSRFLTSPTPPHPDHEDIHLSVALLGQPMIIWDRGVQVLPLGNIAAAEETELIQIRLLWGEHQMEWLQKAHMEPPPGLERDRQTLARHLDARTFLMWIRSLLNQSDLLDGGGDWWQERKTDSAHGPKYVSAFSWAPTLEDVLKAWCRNPATLIDVDRKVRHYLEIMKSVDEQERSVEEQSALDEFWQFWQVLSAEFLPQQKAG